MRRIIDKRQTKKIGKCIYCGRSDVQLSDEHITPLGLSGKLVLVEASCASDAKITGELERRVLRGMWFAARAALRTTTRHKKDREKHYPMVIERNGKPVKVYAPLEEHWKIIQLPIFPLPSHLDDRTYSDGIEYTSMDTYELDERGVEVAARFGASRVVAPEILAIDFARFIAKMAYGYAIEKYGLEAFENIYVLSSILGQSNDIGRWVGCPTTREFPIRECNISVGFIIESSRELIVKIKMFPRFDGVEYVIVVGKIKAVYRDFFLVRETFERKSG